MSRKLNVTETFEVVDSFKAVVSDFARREQKLNTDFRERTAAEQERCDKAVQEVRDQLCADTGEAAEALQQARQAVETKHKGRVAWTTRAARTSKKRAMDRIDDKEGKRIHRLQMDTMQMTRNRETGLAAAEKALQDFRANLAAENERLGALEQTARKSFAGYGSFTRLLTKPAEPDSVLDEHQMLLQLRENLSKADSELRRFGKKVLPLLFRFRWILLGLVLCQIPLVPVLDRLGKSALTYPQAGASVGAFLVVGFILHQFSKSKTGPLAASIARSLVKARYLHDKAATQCETRYTMDVTRLETETQSKNQWIADEWNVAVEEAKAAREVTPGKMDEKGARVSAKNQEIYKRQIQATETEHAALVERLKKEAAAKIEGFTNACSQKQAQYRAEFDAQWRILESEWKTKITPLYESAAASNAAASELFPTWEPTRWQHWMPPSRFPHVAQFARIDVDIPALAGAVPKDPKLALAGPARLSLPLLLTYPENGSVVFETKESGRDAVLAALNNIMLRLLTVAPAGKLAFTVIDPVGLGQSFSGVMHLADYADYLINSRIWTQASQIEEKLAELNEHMEKVIQMYLRNEYQTIAEYNEQAGNIAEKYHFLVVADFPTNFTEVAAKRLLSIATSGARCGVYTLIHWNQNQPIPPDLIPDELRKSSISIGCKGDRFFLTGKSFPGTNIVLDAPPAPEFAIELTHKIGQSSRDSNRVEVPFTHVAPADDQIWSVETTNELRVPIGRTGATKLQYLAIGKGTRQHALLAGKTGSGKSTLFHVIITNLALWCSPEQVEFYLIDFKKGVEFKCYATHKLPHARVVAIESDREFGLSVLQRIDDELKRRGELFRKLSVQDLAGYKRAGGTEALPRSLLMIDEFQEFFVEDDKISQTASVLLDRIVRQGRAFGIHVLLGSQTLGGAYTMARTTIGQMVIRIALQCNEADAYLIMDDNNPAPRLLSRPGEGIYNDAAGAIEGNSPFQAVWISDEIRDGYLEKVCARARKASVPYSAPVVFEGNAPADISENAILQRLLHSEPTAAPVAPRFWLGTPNSIKGPTEAAFHRQSGNNLLVVGQSDEAILSIFSVALVSLAAQHPPGTARFILFDGSAPGSAQRDYLDRLIPILPHEVTVAKNTDAAEIMNGLVAEMKTRADNESATAPVTFVFIHGLQKLSKLRYEDDYSFSSDDAGSANPGSQLNKVISEGTALGLHVIASLDTYNNVNRYLSKKALSEFEMRVLFQMSANDSASLIDNPRAGTLGMHRALFYNEQEGYIEVFRPYALPSDEWIDQAAACFSRFAKK